jgi:hypothetical protein
MEGEIVMAEEHQPAGFCRWRRTGRRTRAAKEIEMEIRLRERQRARRYADREARDRIHPSYR